MPFRIATAVTAVAMYVVMAAVPAGADTAPYYPGSYGGSSQCGLNPTCHATSFIAGDGAFGLDVGFGADVAASPFGSSESFAATGHTLLQQTGFVLRNFCDWPYNPPQFTATVHLADLRASFTSDGQSDERGGAYVAASLAYIDSTYGYLSDGYGATFPFVDVNGGAQSVSQLSEHDIVFTRSDPNPGSLGFVCDGRNLDQPIYVAVTIDGQLSRGRPALSGCVAAFLGICVGYEIDQPDLHADDMTISGRVASITVT